MSVWGECGGLGDQGKILNSTVDLYAQNSEAGTQYSVFY